MFNSKDIKPMLLNETEKPFNDNNYLYELKYDGIRALIYVSKNRLRVITRNGKDVSGIYPELKSIQNLVKDKEVIFDGEIVAFLNDKPSFRELSFRHHLKNKSMIEKKIDEIPVCFMAFDIIYENKDLTKLPLLDRKKYLDKYDDTDCFIKTKTIPEKGIHLFKSVCKMGLEGIVAKNINGLYHISTRTDDFIKIKNLQRDEFYIGGYEEKKNGILSLAIGEYSDDGKVFHFAGKVSIGKKVSIYNKVKKAKKSKNYFSDFDEDIFYIKPTIIVNVSYLERTKSNHLRHPVFNDI